MDTVLDIIDCFRRGGKLHVRSVQKILKGVYWLFKKFPNIREATVTDPDQNLIVSRRSFGSSHPLLHHSSSHTPSLPPSLLIIPP